MLSVLLTALVTYLITSLLGYVVHWAIHQRWTGRAYEAHQAHHIDLYPPGKLISDKYLSAGKKSTVYTFLLAFSPLLILPVVMYFVGWFSIGMSVAAIAAMAAVGLLNDIIHDSFHIRNHWLSRVIPSYGRMRELHFIHHINMKRNFGIYSFVWDRVFRTFRQ